MFYASHDIPESSRESRTWLYKGLHIRCINFSLALNNMKIKPIPFLSSSYLEMKLVSSTRSTAFISVLLVYGTLTFIVSLPFVYGLWLVEVDGLTPFAVAKIRFLRSLSNAVKAKRYRMSLLPFKTL